jgi:hypothetical protein
MYVFALMIAVAIVALINNLRIFGAADRYLTDCSSVPKIDKNQSLINKILVMSIFEWKKDKRKFVYYSEWIIYVLSALQIPWLVFVYFKEWYLIREIRLWYFIICFLIAEVPGMIYTILIKSYERKVEKTKKRK